MIDKYLLLSIGNKIIKVIPLTKEEVRLFIENYASLARLANLEHEYTIL